MLLYDGILVNTIAHITELLENWATKDSRNCVCINM